MTLLNLRNVGFVGSLQPAGAVGGWKELGRETLGSTSATITSTSFTDKKYYMILGHVHSSGSINLSSLVGNTSIDTASNYASRRNIDGTSETGFTNQSATVDGVGASNAQDRFIVQHWANRSANEKLGIGHMVHRGSAGELTAPQRVETVHKWDDTTNPMRSYQIKTTTGTYAIGSELVVLGWDPDDTHTDNFWEELDSTELGSSASSISSTFTAKKYLWVQGFCIPTGGTADVVQTFNSDTDTNYASRGSHNGASDVVYENRANDLIAGFIAQQSTPYFFNKFIVNVSGREKLTINHTVQTQTAGAGNVPDRHEVVGKWDNTGSQISSIQTKTTSNNYATGSIVKVWGHD